MIHTRTFFNKLKNVFGRSRRELFCFIHFFPYVHKFKNGFDTLVFFLHVFVFLSFTFFNAFFKIKNDF